MKTSPTIEWAACSLALFLMLAAEAAFSAPLFNDQFVDGDRTSQTPALGLPPYSSVPWHASSAAYVFSSTAGLKVSPYTSGVSATSWAYFAPQESPVSLQPGESIQLTFDYTYNTNYGGTINMLRFGLFHGGEGIRIDVDGTHLTQSTLQGYTVQTNAQTTSGTGSAVYVENNNGFAGNAFSSSGGGTYAKVGTDFPSIDASNLPRTARMKLTRTSGGMDIVVDTDISSPGDEVTRSLSGSVPSSFDAVGFAHQSTGDAGKWITFTNVKVEHLPLPQSPVLLDDQFADGDRTSQTPGLGLPPYSSVPWAASSSSYVSTSTAGLKVSPYTSGVSAMAWAYFTPVGSPATLETGDSIRLTFDYTYNTNYGGVINMLRFGLFDGGPGSRVMSDGTFMAQTTLRGYTVQTNAQTTSGTGSAIYVENNNGFAGSAFTTSGGGTYAKVGTDFPSFDATNVTRTAQMTVKRTATGMDIIVDTNTATPGDEVTRSHTGDVLTSFDAVGFAHQSMGDASKWITFQNVKVERIAGVPPMPSGGFGTQTRGGLDGNVVKVTSLANSGTGTLRAALQQSGARTVVFEVSGQIDLTSYINITNPHVTVAGETAPSPGITITGAPVRVSTHNVVLRHLRLRIGNAPGGYSLDDRDGIQLVGVTGTPPPSPVIYNVVVDHCSVSWSADESISTYFYGISDVTISNSIVSEALKNAGHSKGSHSMAVLIGPTTKNATVLGNIFAHNGYRNPVLSGGATAIVANNVIYNNTHNGFHTYGVSNEGSYGYNQPVEASVLNNVRIPGPEQNATKPFYVVDSQGGSNPQAVTHPESRIYLAGNLIPEGSALVVNADYTNYTPPYPPGHTPVVSTPPITLPSLQLLPASEVEAALLLRAGARPKDRDAVDQRIINEVQTRTGHSINTQNDVGGWPVLVQNYRALTPPSNLHGDDDGDGLSNLEEWLEGMRLEVDY